jgi:hypothetical protein
MLENAVSKCTSYRQVLRYLQLKPAGGNYRQIQLAVNLNKINISHFKGKGWNKGLRGIGKKKYSLSEILVVNSTFQSYKLKLRLFKAGIKQPVCEECSWSGMASDGRIPVELDHINGDALDNRLENLRILCPNCHSLKGTHRGKNIQKARW